MRIENLRREERGDRLRIAATLTWEERHEPPQEIYFETIKEFGEGLWPNPTLFSWAASCRPCIMGSSGYQSTGNLPEVRLGLMAATRWILHWFYGPDNHSPVIEARIRPNGLSPTRPERAGMFFSGGLILSVPSGLTAQLPIRTPLGGQDGLLVFGLETDEEEKFDHVVRSMREVAREQDSP